MNKTAKRILYFGLIFIGSNVLAIVLFRKSGADKTRFGPIESAFLNNNKKYEYLFMGHSRGVHGVDTNRIENSFNFCSSGENNVYTYYKLKYLLENAPEKFNTVVIPYGFGTFNTTGIGSVVNAHHWVKYVDYLEIGKIEGNASTYYSLKLKASFLPYFQYPVKRINRYLRKRDKNRQYDIADKSYEELIEIAIKGIEINAGKRNIYSTTSSIYLQKTIDLCNEYDKRLIAVKYPVSYYYYEAYEKHMAGDTEKMKKTEAVILQNPNIKTLDFEKLYLKQDTFFRDVNHLNEKGRIHFSKLMNQQLKQQEG